MAYVSQANISKELGRGRGSKTPSISFRMTKSGSTGCRVTKVTGLYSESIDIQIDEGESKLRIGKPKTSSSSTPSETSKPQSNYPPITQAGTSLLCYPNTNPSQGRVTSDRTLCGDKS